MTPSGGHLSRDFEAELRIVISHRCRDEVPDALRQRIADQLAALDDLCDPTLPVQSTASDADTNSSI